MVVMYPPLARGRPDPAISENPSLSAFLDSRANAFMSDDYYESDMAWMDMKEYDHAIRSFSEAIRLKPDYDQAHWKLESSKLRKKWISPPPP